jgi:drug/metabolite transporter (DMT)-like permease
MAWTGLGATIGLLAAVWIAGERLLPSTPKGWLWVAALALVAQIGGQTLIAFALAHLSMAFSAVSLLVQPFVAACAAWALFGESLGPLQLAGGALILGGIVTARLGDLPKS